MKKILIIGSEGFIGSHSVEFFLQKGWQVYGVDVKEITHPKYNYSRKMVGEYQYEDLIKKIQPEACLIAAGSANVAASIAHPFDDFEANTVHVLRILEALRLGAPTCKVINLSSAAVYGNPVQMPVSESSVVSPVSPYGWHKHYSELICEEYYKQYGLRTCSLRPFSVYGVGQAKLLFWDIYNKTLQNDQAIELYGTGQESRDFVYISDVVSAINVVINSAPHQGERYNLASGQEVEIKEVARVFLNELNYGGALKFNNKTKIGDPLNWKADISALRNLGYSPAINIQTGLEKYAQWLKGRE
jgi:UDP-glucose 4-epimerase